MITKYHLEHIVLTGAKDKKNKSKALLFIKIDCTMIFKHFGPVDLLTTTHSGSLFIEFARLCQQTDARLIIISHNLIGWGVVNIKKHNKTCVKWPLKNISNKDIFLRAAVLLHIEANVIFDI